MRMQHMGRIITVMRGNRKMGLMVRRVVIA
jgi:hypothetical protein